MARDNWGDLARIGMFIVGREVVPEAEWWAMAPAGVSIHAARVNRRVALGALDGRQGGGHAVRRSRPRLPGFRRHRCRRGGARPFLQQHRRRPGLGRGDDRSAWRSAGPEGSPTTNGADVPRGARPSRREPAIPGHARLDVGQRAHRRGRYLDGYGTPASAIWRYRPPAPWDALPPDGLYPAGMATAQETEGLMAQVLEQCPAHADGILLAGTGFRCVGIIAELEARLGGRS